MKTTLKLPQHTFSYLDQCLILVESHFQLEVVTILHSSTKQEIKINNEKNALYNALFARGQKENIKQIKIHANQFIKVCEVKKEMKNVEEVNPILQNNIA